MSLLVPSARTLPRRPVPAGLLTTGILLLLAAAAYPVRDALYLAAAGSAAESAAAPAVGIVAESGLWLLVAAAGGIAAWSLLRDRLVFLRLASAGAGVIGAYLFSEGIKLIVTEQRPCRALVVETVLACPVEGDWSWPSNHSVLAAAFAAACVLALGRTAWLVVPAAVLLAGSRVAGGVHYVHDVLSGLALGTLVVTVVVYALDPVVRRLAVRSSRPDQAPGASGQLPDGPPPAGKP